MKPKIFIDRHLPPLAEQFLNDSCIIDKWEEQDTIPRDELHRRLEDAQGYITSGRRIDEELLRAAPNLKAVSTISVGYNHFDIEAMKRFHVLGTHTPSVLDETVADLVFSLMLGSARRVAELDRYVREGNWSRGDGANLFGMDVHHATIGIIGMGRIGEAVARRARFGFEMEVQYYNRSRKPEAEMKYDAVYRDLDLLLATSDFVVMLTPLSEQTKSMIGKREFALMKRSAFFINASRGATIDEAALIEALQNGVIRGAGLDVFEKEPVSPDNALLQLPNTVLLPHLGSATAKTRDDMAMLAAHNLVDVLEGKPCSYIIPELRL